MSEMTYYVDNPVWLSSYLYKCQPFVPNDISSFVAMHRMELYSNAYQQNLVQNFHCFSLGCAKLATCSDPTLNATTAQTPQWNGYRDEKKSTSDSTDTESEQGKDVISPGIISSPDPCSPFYMESSKARNPSLPNILHLSRNRFNFDTVGGVHPTQTLSGDGQFQPKLKLVRERSRSESEATSTDNNLKRRMVAPQLYKKRILERYTAEVEVSTKRRKTPPDPMHPTFVDQPFCENYRSAAEVNIRRLELPLQPASVTAAQSTIHSHQKLMTANLHNMNITTTGNRSEEPCSSITDLSEMMTGNLHTRLNHRRSRSETDLNSSFVCNYCGQLFEMKDRLLKHVASRHRQNVNNPAGEQREPTTKQHTCFICQKSFGRSDMLTRHMRLHTGIKPYSCNICNQVFSRSDHLSTHQRTHTGEKPYQCPQCSYSASRRDMITRHLRTHNKLKSADLLPIQSNSFDMAKSYVSVIQHSGSTEKAKATDHGHLTKVSMKMEVPDFGSSGNFSKPSKEALYNL